MDSSNSAQCEEFLNAPSFIGCISHLAGNSEAPGPASDEIPPIASVQLAMPVFVTKGLQFPVQPVKIINSELLLAIGPVSGHVVHRKELG
jgi:hypothetical protein